MYLRLASFPLLLLLLFFQAPGDLFRKHYEAANNYHRAGNYSGAEAEFKIILGQAYQRLGKIYSAQGNYKSSVETLESATATRHDSTDGLVDQAIAYFHTAQYAKSIVPLERVIAADPKNPTAHHMLGKTFFMMGQFDKAARELEQTLKLTPGDYDAEYTLGLCFLKRQRCCSGSAAFRTNGGAAR